MFFLLNYTCKRVNVYVLSPIHMGLVLPGDL